MASMLSAWRLLDQIMITRFQKTFFSSCCSNEAVWSRVASLSVQLDLALTVWTPSSQI